MHQKLREPFDTREQGHPPQRADFFAFLVQASSRVRPMMTLPR
jgi:hypothetical protein